MATGISIIVYQIVKNAVENEGKDSVSLNHIRKELEKDKRIDLSGHYVDNKRKDKKIPKIEAETNQALQGLRRKKLIVKRGRTKYGLPNIDERKRQEKKKYNQRKCCALRKYKGRENWCPVIRSYIGDPKTQCGVLFVTDHNRIVEARQAGIEIKEGEYVTIRPKKPCYFYMPPKKGELEICRERIRQRNAEEQKQKNITRKHRGEPIQA